MEMLRLLLLLCTLAPLSFAGRILILCPFNGKSHWLFFEKFIYELVQRGHEVTAITGLKYSGPTVKNYHEVLIEPAYDFEYMFPPGTFFHVPAMSYPVNIFVIYAMGLANSEHGLNSTNVQRFINDDSQQFDVVISEQFFQETWLMFGRKFNAPLITINTFGCSDFMDYAQGLVTPLAYVPHIVLDFDDRMSFGERCYNVFLAVVDRLIRTFYYMPRNNRLAAKYFTNLPGQLPKVEDLEKSIALMLMNINPAQSRPRPAMPNQINIGGAHLRPNPKPLPENLQKFLDEAAEGVIYMSLGSFLRSAEMPKEKAVAILNAFAELEQRVIWKWEKNNTPELPSNVMVDKWLPQADILAHENIRLFITHGGTFGTEEGVYNGVPMLFIPFYGDQFRNAAKNEKAGNGLSIKFSDITTETLLEKLNQLLTNETFSTKAKKLAKIFRDQPIHPMENAIFHIEYVMRHNGAEYLKSAATDLSWYQHLLLDVLALILVAILLVAISVWFVVWRLCDRSGLQQSQKLKAS